MKVSACWIAKNEEANIARSIESLREIADELIVVDTGSTDKTMEIAGGFGAKVYGFEWKRDFSEARNYAVSKAAGDIIFFLDADEWFSPGLIPENKKLLKQIFADDKTEAVSLTIHHLDTRTGMVIAKGAVIRAFRSEPHLRYTQKIHEQLTDIERNRIITAVHFDDWKLLHSGYSPDIVDKKAARNIEMLGEMRDDGKASVLQSFYLMRENYAVGNYEESFACFEKLLRDETAASQFASKYGAVTGLAGSYFFLALNIAVKFRSRVSRRELYDRLVKKMKKLLPDFSGTSLYYLAYQVFFDLKEDVFLKGLEEYEKLPKKESASMGDTYLGSFVAVYKNAAIICWRRGDMEKAMRYAIICLKQNIRFDEKVMMVLLNCLRGRNDADIIRILASIFDVSNETGLRQVTNSLRFEGFKIPYMYFLKRQIDNGTATIADFLYMMILAGKHEKAVQAALEMRDGFSGSDAIGQAIFLAAVCAEDDSIFTANSGILADYAHILEAYFKRCPLEEVTDSDRAILKNNYLYIAFAAGLQAGDRFLSIFSKNRDLSFELKANYLMSSGRFDISLSEDTEFIAYGNAEFVYIVIECCLRTGKYEEALRRIENYLQKNLIFPDLLQSLLFISQKASNSELKSTAKALYDRYMCLYDEYIDLQDVINTGYVVDGVSKKEKKYLKTLSSRNFDALISSASGEAEWEQLMNIRFQAAGVYEEKGMPAMAEPVYRRILACGGDSGNAYERLIEVYKALNNVALSQHIRDQYMTFA